MPASEVQGPLGLQLNLPSHIPGVRSVAYNTSEDQLLAPGRTRTQPIGESSQGPSYVRERQSESSLNVHAPMPVPRSPPAADNAAPESPPSAPSPVPTEIIAVDLTQEEIVDDIQQSGIKVRDFAYEKSVPLEQYSPELFDPILGWHVYEAMLENPNPERNPLNGRHLRRLLDLGWVSEEADGHRWLKKDREALEKFDSRPHYPWKSLDLPKPKKDDLREVATSRFQWVNAEQLVPQFVNRGISRLAAAFRGSRKTARFQKRPAIDATETEEDSEASPQLKKRRLSVSAESVASGSQPAPSSPAYFPLTLVNGKPPQQFPAGHPSDGPPRPAPAPTQGTLSRSLQRHLSMTSLSSPCSVDVSRSDSRTLTSGTNHE
ncbi:hypothetical protein J3R82DRAFT_7469 [Butyriboletus roseoflavus]|nr:hypothetical protein J3R82DRAFT_7469 [Butyriboletus roseoflavus]